MAEECNTKLFLQFKRKIIRDEGVALIFIPAQQPYPAANCPGGKCNMGKKMEGQEGGIHLVSFTVSPELFPHPML